MSAPPEVAIAEVDHLDAAELGDLYRSVGWSAYADDPAALAAAMANSGYRVAARAGDRLIGLARGISDDVSIFYLQDLLVRPEWQRRGVGRALLEQCLERFAHVRQKVLLTDADPAQHRFYRALGYRDVTEFAAAPLHAFVRIEGRSGD